MLNATMHVGYVSGIVKALKEDEDIDRKHAQAMFIGPGESGKTSLMDRLLKRPRIIYTSTGVVKSVVIVDVDMENPPAEHSSSFHAVAVFDSDTWEEVKFDKSIVSHMHESVYTLQLHQTQTKKESEASLQPPIQPTATPAPVSVSAEGNLTADVGRPLLEPAATSIPSTRRPPVSDGIREVISSAVERHGGYTKFDSLLKRKFSLYLRDAGGQVEFQEMVSLLVFGPSIFLFVFRADRDLKSTFQVRYRKSATESLNHYTSSITTEEALLQCLASVYAMDTSSQAGHHTPNPHVFIVATHKDKLGPSANQKINQLNKDVKSLIIENGFESLVQYADRAKGQVMFTVDNTSDSDEDFKPIRSSIHDLVVSSKEFTIKYRLSYLLFCLELQSDQRNVLTFDECTAMAAKYNIVGDNVSDLLYFLHHRIGIIHFINIEGVKCIAMKRPEDLFNKVTDLVVGTFSCGTFNLQEAEDLKKGILTTSAFERVVSSEEVITADEFLKILVHLRIIAEFTRLGDKEKKYFIPCVLNHVSESTGEELKTDIMPLFVKFKSKHCPKGLFGVLVTHLMTPEADEREGSDIYFTLRDDKIFKDQVSFRVESSSDLDEISLKLHPQHLEINFYPDKCDQRDTPTASVCDKVRERIELSISSSLKDLHYSQANVKPMMCVDCENCSQLHQVRVGKFVKVYCEEGGRSLCVPPQGECWWNKGE